MGELFAILGKEDRAAASFREALQLDPGSQPARAGLARLSGSEPEPAAADRVADEPPLEKLAAPAPAHPPTPTGAVAKLEWSGEVPWQQWEAFYDEILSSLSMGGGLTLRVVMEVTPPGGVSPRLLEKTEAALAALGLRGELRTSP